MGANPICASIKFCARSLPEGKNKIIINSCPGGGTGIHYRLKICRPQGIEGSTPSRGTTNQNLLTFPFWCSILELVRTHFSGKFPPRKVGKAAEPHRSKPQKNPEKNIGSNHILILGEENF